MIQGNILMFLTKLEAIVMCYFEMKCPKMISFWNKKGTKMGQFFSTIFFLFPWRNHNYCSKNKTWPWTINRLRDNGKNGQKHHYATASNVFLKINGSNSQNKNFPRHNIAKNGSRKLPQFSDQVIVNSDVSFRKMAESKNFFQKSTLNIFSLIMI